MAEILYTSLGVNAWVILTWLNQALDFTGEIMILI